MAEEPDDDPGYRRPSGVSYGRGDPQNPKTRFLPHPSKTEGLGPSYTEDGFPRTTSPVDPLNPGQDYPEETEGIPFDSNEQLGEEPRSLLIEMLLEELERERGRRAY
jgi:hypothetical protein